ncbi:hypothetical protein [Streptomyces sp. NPDC093544]|uniref:hypothetical protein n=1 Tax=Streptomyces sp. NPDC093544 TaxID=3155200 RepID=UPI00344908A5
MKRLPESVKGGKRPLFRGPAPAERGRPARYGRAPGTALLVAVTLLTVGCSNTSDVSASTPSSTDPVSGVPVPSSSPSPSLSPLYPTNAAGCHPNAGWTPKEESAWLMLRAYTPDENWYDGPDTVRISAAVAGSSGPLCEPLTVQVEFWELTYGSAAGQTSATGGAEQAPDYYFDMRSVQRTELRVDGRKEHLVEQPKKLYADDRSVCTGALLAIYSGKPLTSEELPENINTGDNINPRGDVDFNADRVATYELSAPSAPHVCSPEGIPTADPSDVPFPSTVPDPLYPTPEFSFDFDDVQPKSTP